MSKSVLQFAMLFVVLVLAQALIFNHVALYSVALAFVFVYFIVKLPVSLSPGKVIALSFLIGLAVDIFSDTPGMNSLACTCLGGCRRTVLRLYVAREDDIARAVPSIRSLGAGVFIKYVISMSLIYCTLVFLIEAMSFFSPSTLLMRIVASTLLTSALLFAFDSLSIPSAASEKRL